MELSKERLERLRELLAPAHQQIVIVSHTNPDGDAVGSSLAWAEALRSMGHEVTCVVPNKYPYFLDWMQGIEEVVVFKNDTEGRAARAIGHGPLRRGNAPGSLRRVRRACGSYGASPDDGPGRCGHGYDRAAERTGRAPEHGAGPVRPALP